MLDRVEQLPNELIGVGLYTERDAARLLGIPQRNISRWLLGYHFPKKGNQKGWSPPLWEPQLPKNENRIELGFRDLIELRFVDSFLKASLPLGTIRKYLSKAKEIVNDDRPFSTRKFQTDGRTIFLDSVKESGDSELLDLKNSQFALKQIIQKTFKDLDIDDDAVVRWRPYKGKDSIVIDPKRSFGQPIASRSGVPTIVLYQSALAENSPAKTAKLFDVPISVVSDAIRFEESLIAA